MLCATVPRVLWGPYSFERAVNMPESHGVVSKPRPPDPCANACRHSRSPLSAAYRLMDREVIISKRISKMYIDGQLQLPNIHQTAELAALQLPMSSAVTKSLARKALKSV